MIPKRKSGEGDGSKPAKSPDRQPVLKSDNSIGSMSAQAAAGRPDGTEGRGV